MKRGTRVTFARCHRLHRAETRALVGQSGVVMGRTTMGDLIVALDDGATIAVAPQWLTAEDVRP